MTKADAAKLVAIVVTAYPNYDKFRDEAAVTATVNLWATIFQADDGRIVALALNKHIATSKWPPSVAEIRELMLEIQHPELIPPEQATYTTNCRRWWPVQSRQSAGATSTKCTGATAGEASRAWIGWPLWIYTSQCTSERSSEP